MRLLKIFLVGIAVCMFIFTNTKVHQTSSVIASTQKVPQVGCPANSDWFKSTNNMPDTNEPTAHNDCEFYKWAWETFLNVIQPDSDGRPRFLNYETPTGLFGINATPQFKSSKKKVLLLAPRLVKSQDPADLNSVIQAQSGPLIAQNGRSVYYAQHLNFKYVDFIKNKGYTDTKKLLDPKEDSDFDLGSLELKSSWMVITPEDEQKDPHLRDKYFVLEKANIPPWIKKTDATGRTIVVPDFTKTIPVKVALIGLHVVGVVKNHPEFIWSTFEHRKNAPNPDHPESVTPETIIDPNNDYALYTHGTKAKDCNTRPGSRLTFVDENKQLLSPITCVYRVFPWGTKDGSADTATEEDPAITDLNKNVLAELQNPSTTLPIYWQNYYLRGAIWLNDYKDFTADADYNDIKAHSDGTPARFPLEGDTFGGEKKLSNATMESFTQKDGSFVNCFSCHRTVAEQIPNSTEKFPAKKLLVSHAILEAFSNKIQTANLKKLKTGKIK